MMSTLRKAKTLSGQEKVTLSELNKLFGGKEICSFLRDLILKESEVNAEYSELQSTPTFQPSESLLINNVDNWETLSKTTAIADENDREKIEQAYFEIRDLNETHFKFIDKKIGYVRVEEAYKMGPSLDILPVTAKQIIDRNQKSAFKKNKPDPDLAYVLVVNTLGRKRLRKISPTEAEELYRITTDENGKQVYEVNLALLLRMSQKKRNERYNRAFGRQLRPRLNEKQENENKEAQLKQKRSALISNDDDEEEKELSIPSKASKKVFDEQDHPTRNQLDIQLSLFRDMKKRLSEREEEIYDLQNEKINLKRKIASLDNRVLELEELVERVGALEELVRRLSKESKQNEEFREASKQSGLFRGSREISGSKDVRQQKRSSSKRPSNSKSPSPKEGTESNQRSFVSKVE